MINNKISLAQYKLKLHQDQGQNSELSIIEVAKLMDIIYFGPCDIEDKKDSIFLQFSYN